MLNLINFESLHTAELEFIRWMHALRTPFLDNLVKLFDFFDRQEFFFVLIPIIWFGNGWKAGLRLYFILMISNLTNHALKEYFSLLRPFHMDPSVGLIQVAGYGFPSGAAQSVILLSAILLSWRKNIWTLCLAGFYVFSVSGSRIYLGLHFPTDILAGWLIGGCLWLVYSRAMPLIERSLEGLQPLSLFIISQIIPFALLLWQPTPPVIRMTSLAMGMCLGLFIHQLCHLQLSLPQSLKEYVLRALIAVIGTFLFYELTQIVSFENKMITLYSRFFLLGLWVSLGCHLICRYLFLKSNTLPTTREQVVPL
jgi:undecaprenyl-diphosphatase